MRAAAELPKLVSKLKPAASHPGRLQLAAPASIVSATPFVSDGALISVQKIAPIRNRVGLHRRICCGRSELVTLATVQTGGVNAFAKLADLIPRLRYREGDQRGQAVVSIEWGQQGQLTESWRGAVIKRR